VRSGSIALFGARDNWSGIAFEFGCSRNMLTPKNNTPVQRHTCKDAWDEGSHTAICNISPQKQIFNAAMAAESLCFVKLDKIFRKTPPTVGGNEALRV
jgi:hypothetical protein